MSNHAAIHSKADLDKALETKGKYVLVHAHDGGIAGKAEELATQYKANCDAYSVDTKEEPKLMEYFGITQAPAAILYKDGAVVKKAEGANPAAMQEIISLIS